MQQQISQLKVEWIKTVREYCADFLIEFQKDKPNIELLKELFIKIKLYGYGDVYTQLFKSLNECILFLERPVKEQIENKKNKLLQNLIDECQKVLNGVWWRVKKEAGITKLADDRIHKQYKNKYFNKNL